MFPGKPCHFNTRSSENCCAIYEDRPQFCKDFRCLWLARAEVLPEWMRPDLSGAVMVLRAWGLEQKPYIMVLECGVPLDAKVLSWLFLYHLGNGIPIAYQLHGHITYIGPREFAEWASRQKEPQLLMEE